MLLDQVLTGNRLNEYGAHLSQTDRDQARGLLANQRDQMRTRIRNCLLTAYGLSRADTDAVDDGHDPEGRFISLDPGIDLRPPVAANIEEALQDVFGQALAARYPDHPEFGVEVRRPALRRVLEVVERAAAHPEERVEVDRRARDDVRHIAVPLQLGEMGELHFKLGRRWPDELDRKRAQHGGDTLSAGELRAWIEAPATPSGTVADDARCLRRDVRGSATAHAAMDGRRHRRRRWRSSSEAPACGPRRAWSASSSPGARPCVTARRGTATTAGCPCRRRWCRWACTSGRARRSTAGSLLRCCILRGGSPKSPIRQDFICRRRDGSRPGPKLPGTRNATCSPRPLARGPRTPHDGTRSSHPRCTPPNASSRARGAGRRHRARRARCALRGPRPAAGRFARDATGRTGAAHAQRDHRPATPSERGWLSGASFQRRHGARPPRWRSVRQAMQSGDVTGGPGTGHGSGGGSGEGPRTTGWWSSVPGCSTPAW